MLLVLSMPISLFAQTTIPPASTQIKLAELAAPLEKRSGATVLGFDASGKLAILRQGTNEMICLADDPRQKGFSVSCYHKDLEPFMQRGRELKAEGKSQADVITFLTSRLGGPVRSLPQI